MLVYLDPGLPPNPPVLSNKVKRKYNGNGLMDMYKRSVDFQKEQKRRELKQAQELLNMVNTINTLKKTQDGNGKKKKKGGKLFIDTEFDKSKISLGRYIPIANLFGKGQKKKIGNGLQKIGNGAIMDYIGKKAKDAAKNIVKTQVEFAVDQGTSDLKNFLKTI